MNMPNDLSCAIHVAVDASTLASEDLERFLISEVAARLHCESDHIDIDEPLTRYGIDSLAAIEIAHEAEQRFGRRIPFETLVEGVSIRQIMACSSAPEARAITLAADSFPDSLPFREYALSPGQEAMWVLHNQMPLSPAYNIASAIRIRSTLDAPQFKRSLQTIVDRHSALRTTFRQNGGSVTQRVYTDLPVAFEWVDAADWDESLLSDRLSAEAQKPFDLGRGPLFKAHVFSRAVRDHIVLIVAHHIIADFWSLTVVLRELAQLYGSSQRREPVTLAKPVQYTDYVHYLKDSGNDPGLEAHWEYWRGQLEGELPKLDLPVDRARPAVNSYRGASESFMLDAELSRGLKRLSSEIGVTLYVTLLGIYQVLLHRYTGKDDLIVGSSLMGRTRPELAGVVGYLVNSLPLRARFHYDLTFRGFLDQLRQTIREALEHQDLPFSTLVERLQPLRAPGRSPIFDTLFVFQKPPAVAGQQVAALALSVPGVKLTIEGLNCEPFILPVEAAQFDLTCMTGEVGESIGVSIKYSSDLFDPETIARLCANFQRLAKAVLANPDQRVSDLPLCSETETEMLLTNWSQVESDDWAEDCVLDLFERQVRLTPDAIAVAYEGERQTYGRLNNEAAKLAARLQSLGVDQETPVAICASRGIDMIVGLLAVLKAGGIYAPLDPSEPDDRLAMILDLIRPPVLLTETSLVERFATTTINKLYLDDRGLRDENQPPPVSRRATGDNLAYVIFTSGSTGVPRGVGVERRQLLNYMKAIIKSMDFPAAANFALVSTIAADLGNTMIFPSLCTGGCLHVISRDRSLSPQDMASYAAENFIDCLKIVPSHLDALLRGARGGQVLPKSRLILGGEACDWELIERIQSLAPTCAVINHYGPTETTVGVLTHALRRRSDGPYSTTVPIGRPLSNVQIYALDRNMQPAPIGVAAELLIGGDSVSRGYIGNATSTAERYIPNPFGKSPGARLFRVGDLARFLPDGTIEYIGRTDDQVKIRGFRIEIGEVEAAIKKYPSVRRVAVSAVDMQPGGKQLIGYIVPDPQNPPAAKSLHQFLKQKLPEAMIPSTFVLTDSLPLTLNGKVDRRALNKLEGMILSERDDPVEALSPVEQSLAAIWERMLGVESVSTNDGFFELGGHSLLATQMISQLQDIFPSETPLLTLFFQNPTVAGLADAILQGQDGSEGVERTAHLIATANILCEV